MDSLSQTFTCVNHIGKNSYTNKQVPIYRYIIFIFIKILYSDLLTKRNRIKNLVHDLINPDLEIRSIIT